ncbi:hypothetical protein GCM10025777_57240 [Membranihabitans marinus]
MKPYEKDAFLEKSPEGTREIYSFVRIANLYNLNAGNNEINMDLSHFLPTISYVPRWRDD